jgi:hypothetical protein
VECRCLWLTGEEALIELPTRAQPMVDRASFRVELQPNRFLEAPTAALRVGRDSRIVLELQWADFAAMREWWTSAYRDSRTPLRAKRRRLVRRLLSDP